MMGMVSSMFENRQITNGKNPNPDGEFILYWMIANRRTIDNHALELAISLSKEHNLPLYVIEPIAVNHHYSSKRLHYFVIGGMVDNYYAFKETPICYCSYIEKYDKEGSGVFKAWMKKAAITITDHHPTYLPRYVGDYALRENENLTILVNSNSLIPVNLIDRDFKSAYQLRRWIHKNIEALLDEFSTKHPLQDLSGLPQAEKEVAESIFAETKARISPWDFVWRCALDDEAIREQAFKTVNLNMDVPEIEEVRGGEQQALNLLRNFVKKIEVYSDERQNLDRGYTSSLSPYLHFGHISPITIVRTILNSYKWDLSQTNPEFLGKSEGWWNLKQGVEGFLDQVITWREIGFAYCTNHENHLDYDSLPEWARKSLAEHSEDSRPYTYSYEQLENAETHSELWNACQNQLRKEGIIHNYMRMFWAKKILEWTPNPQTGYDYTLDLNDKWALDGRDPNSYSGVGWTFGRFDRPWFEREVFGKIRYMSENSLRKKIDVNAYVKKYSNIAISSRTPN